MTFKVLLHHYGRFTTLPGRRFVGEIVATVDLVELDSFSTNQMKLILTNCLGYDENSPTFLYMKKPNCSLDSGLVPLADAIQDSELILTYTQTHQNQLHVYVSRVELSPLVVADQCKDEGVSGFGIGEVVLSTFDVLQRFGFFLQMGFTLILATLDGLDVGLLGDVIGGDDCDDDE
ncbi:hypothetical protein Tco_0665521 [Tanacetum coccineum]